MNGRSTRKFFKTLGTILVAVILIFGVAVAAALYIMTRRDKEHARFFNTGKAVNVFLGNYTRALRESFDKKDPAPVMSLYSDHYWSPGRGQWQMVAANEESDVLISRVVINGKQDFDKQQLRGEIVNYLGSIAAITNIWTKIDMIEDVELE